jgi:hypothetical protein
VLWSRIAERAVFYFYSRLNKMVKLHPGIVKTKNRHRSDQLTSKYIQPPRTPRMSGWNPLEIAVLGVLAVQFDLSGSPLHQHGATNVLFSLVLVPRPITDGAN